MSSWRARGRRSRPSAGCWGDTEELFGYMESNICSRRFTCNGQHIGHTHMWGEKNLPKRRNWPMLKIVKVCHGSEARRRRQRNRLHRNRWRCSSFSPTIAIQRKVTMTINDAEIINDGDDDHNTHGVKKQHVPKSLLIFYMPSIPQLPFAVTLPGKL